MTRVGSPVVILVLGLLTFGAGITIMFCKPAPRYETVCPTTATHVVTQANAVARSARLTGRLMECYGDPSGWQCRPVGRSQQDYPDEVIGPVVTCIDDTCLVAVVPR